MLACRSSGDRPHFRAEAWPLSVLESGVRASGTASAWVVICRAPAPFSPKPHWAGYGTRLSNWAAGITFRVLSLAPLLVISLAIASILIGNQQSASDQLVSRLTELVGSDGAGHPRSAQSRAAAHQRRHRHRSQRRRVPVGGGGHFWLAASGLGDDLGSSANSQSTFWTYLGSQLLSLTMVLGTGRSARPLLDSERRPVWLEPVSPATRTPAASA